MPELFKACLLCLVLATLVGSTWQAPVLRVRVLPPQHASSIVHPELRVSFVTGSPSVAVDVKASASNGTTVDVLSATYPGSQPVAKFALDLAAVVGSWTFVVTVQSKLANGSIVQASTSFPYLVLNTGVNSTRLLDGAWIEPLHWSESEGLQYNNALRQMAPGDWQNEVMYMAQAGVTTAVIQGVFLNNEYVLHRNSTCHQYDGLNFYPSQIYPNAYPDFVDKRDKIEAILSAADRYGVNVFVGLGMFAWFDFTSDAACFQTRVMNEFWQMYGHHESIYGWYMSAEMAGDFFNGTEYYYPGVIDDMVATLSAIQAASAALDPTLPVLLAPNAEQFLQHSSDWVRVLKHVDILAPFGFARHYPDYSTPAQVLAVCDAAGTRMWVDIEMFQFPITDEGLLPKAPGDLISELRNYDMVENIIGYEFTGLMDSPASRLHVGGPAAATLFEGYTSYYRNVTQ